MSLYISKYENKRQSGCKMQKLAQTHLNNIAKQTIESFGFVGILAVELFVNPNGDVFVNET